MNTNDSDSRKIGEQGQTYLTGLPEPMELPEEATAGDGSFIERMQACAERSGSVNALARRAGLSQSGIRRYFAGGEPTRKVLIALAAAAEVDFRWLATGEGQMDADAIGAAKLPKLNGKALRLAVETVEEALAVTSRNVTTDRKADMVAAAYELFSEGEGKIEKSVVLRLLRSSA